MTISLVKVVIIGTIAERPLIRIVDGETRIAGLSVYTSREDQSSSRGAPREVLDWH